MLLAITPQAAEYLALQLTQAQQGNPLGIRLGVKKTGCSGYEYVVEYVYEARPLDHLIEVPGHAYHLFVDQEILAKFLKGTIVDYETSTLKEGLLFRNPNVGAHCGCGESFSLKPQGADPE